MPIYKSLVRKVSIPAQNKIKQKDYLHKGAYPVIDQGHELIGGYTDDPSKLVRCRLPVIVFGDHTKAVKYITFPFAAGADGIKVLEVAEGIDPRFLFYATKYLTYKIENKGYARHYQFVEKKGVSILELHEQQRIVAHIEELFSQLDDAEATLQKAKAQLALYRQAVLREAFEGKLTEDWRKRNGTTKQCLIQLAREKRDTALACRKLKPLKYEWKDDIILPSIPHEWEYAQIGDIAWSIKDGPHYSPEYSEEGVPFITGGNVRPTGVDFQSAKRISMDLHKELCKRCCPEKGDMLYTKGGTTGIAHVNTYDQEFSVWVHVAVIKFVDSVLPEYFQHVLNSPLCYQQSQKYTHGVGNQDLGLTRMINIIFPICSIEEQKQIVANLESRLSVCDSIEQTIDAALQQAKAMRQSILKDAFEGRL